MRHTTAFLLLLGCLAGAESAMAESAPNDQQHTAEATSVTQVCTQPTPPPYDQDSGAPQNQVEYGGGG